MDSEDEQMYVDDSEEEMSDDDEHITMVMEPEVSSTTHDSQDEDYPFQVLTPEKIVRYMVDCIKDVNTIVEVSSRTLFPGAVLDILVYNYLR